jgi:nucleotide-binding universal stress UspA family protein
MPKPVVVGLDFEREDRAPLVVAAQLARITAAPLVAVAAVLHDPISNAASSGTLDDDLRVQALRGLESLVGDVDADLLVRGGTSPARVLHDVAADLGAAFLVVGSTKRGPVGRVAPGSTAERLLHGAPCPVVLAPAGTPSDWELRTVGAGFIDLDEGHAALAVAAGLAHAARAALVARTAVEPLVWSEVAVIAPYRDAGSADEPADNARRSLDEALTTVRPGVEATSDVVVAKASDALIDLSRRVDMLVCGSRGYGPLRSVLLGGVTHRLLRKAHCPVLIAPRSVDASLDAPSTARETTAT